MENKNDLKCPLCKEIVYSEIGKGCKMCGMPLTIKSAQFCSNECQIKYVKINFVMSNITK